MTRSTAPEGPGQPRPEIRHLSLTWVAGVAALGGLLFGYDTGIIASALPQIAADFSITDNSVIQQVVVSSLLVGCLIGALLAGRVSDRIGRRRVLAGVAVLFAVAALAAAFSPSYQLLILFRLVLGLAVGASSQVVPVYIAELAPRERRGQLVVTFQLAVGFGILVATAIGFFIGAAHGGWRTTTGLGAIPAILLLIGSFFLPETPRFLVLRQKFEDARQVLRRIRTSGYDVDGELAAIVAVEQETAQHATGMSALKQKHVRPALVVGVGIAMLCQITGINAVLYYAPTILGRAGFNLSSSLFASMATGFVLFVFTLLGVFLVDRWGRRKLLLAFVPLSALALLALGACFAGATVQGPPGLVVALLMAYTAFNGGSLSVVAWLIASEVYPLRVRGVAAGLTAFALWAVDLVVSLTSLSVADALSIRGMFWLFGGISLLAFVFIYFRVPETKGRSLEDIEDSLNNGTFYPSSKRGTNSPREAWTG